MKRLTLLAILLTTLAHGQVSYESLKADIHAGVSPEAIKTAIYEQGLGFEVDISLLRTMKADRMPDWLMDLVIELDPNGFTSRASAPRRYADTDSDEALYLRYGPAYSWGLSPWNCVDWYYWCSPWSAWRTFGGHYYYGYGGLGLWWPYYHTAGYIYHHRYRNYDPPGIVTPRGYRHREGRIVGRAYPRNTTPQARAVTVPNRTPNYATRSSSSSPTRATRASSGSTPRATATRSSSSSRSRTSATSSRSSSGSSSRATATRSSSGSSRATSSSSGSRSRNKRN